MKKQKTEVRSQKSEQKTTDRDNKSLFSVFCFLTSVLFSLFTFPAYAQDDVIKFIEKKQKEIKIREEALEKEEKRLHVLKGDIDERIEKYTKLLNNLENILKKLEQIKEGKLEHVVKVYEAMPPEEAAAKLAALDEPTAVEIIRRMKSKKAGAVMAFMNEKKGASITQSLARCEKKIPAE